MSKIYVINLPLMIALASRDLFDFLSTLCSFVDKCIMADVSCIRYEYEIGPAGEIIWIHSKVNLTNHDTKTDSPLTQALALNMSAGCISIDLVDLDSRSRNRNGFMAEFEERLMCSLIAKAPSKYTRVACSS